MTAQDAGWDAGHLLPEADWADVVAAAELEAARIAAGHRHELAPLAVPGRFGTGALQVSGVVTAPRNGGRRAGGAPTFGVLHSAETPLAPGYAASIAGYFRDKAATSCHYMTDPAETWGVLPDELVAWHCGNGNTNSLGLEQSGRAAMTRDQWLVPAGHAQMRRNAAVMRAARDRYGIGLFWMTDQQLRDAHARRIVGGWATHDQCRRVLGGTSHTDPGGGFPLDVQMAYATGEDEDEDMPLTDADVAKLWSYAPVKGQATVADRLVGIDAKDPAAVARAVAERPMGLDGLRLYEAVQELQRAARESAPAAPVVQVDAAAVARALASSPEFLAAVAGSVGDVLARRLQS